MRKWIKTAAWGILAALIVGFPAVLWKLDIPHWQQLDVSLLRGDMGVTEVFDAQGASVGTLAGRQKPQWASLDEVPGWVQSAFIAAEDLRFYRHHGVDLYRTFGALWNDIRTMSLREGGSTITQQLIKITHLSGEKTLPRKAQEIVLALRLERVMNKADILEAYLNRVYFGRGAYGIQAASKAYFGKQADALTLAEGATLAGIIKAPSNYAPHLHPDRALKRRNNILNTMAEHGLVTQTEADEARAEALSIVDESPEDRKYAWYKDAVVLEAAQALGTDADEILTGGYRVYTGLDTAMQSAAEALFESADGFPSDAADGSPVQAGLIALDAKTGEARAVVGGRRYEVAMGLNHATQIKRQPGSAFKPVSTYAAAIDAFGYVPSSTVQDMPRTFEGGYMPRNAGGNSYGTVTLREALSRSLNIATVDLAESIGTDALRQYAARFGIPLSDKDVNLSLALGSLTEGVSPEILDAAYCALANGGTRVTPHFVREIQDATGRTIYVAKSGGDRAVEASTAYMITDMLKTAARTGSARALRDCGLPVAGKTGTVSESNGGTRDIWTVAYTPELATAVWMGFDQPDASHVMAASEGGGGCPAKLCAAFFKAVSKGLSGRDFRKPGTVKAALVDRLALEDEHAVLLTTENTPVEYTQTELFHEDDIPTRYSENWLTPAAATDFRLLTGPGETPVLSFIVQGGSTASEYQLLRTVNGETRQIAVLTGEPGEEVRFADVEHDLSQPADYTLMPRNALLWAAGVALTGVQSPPVHYAPGGLLNAIMGVGAEEPAQTPTEVESDMERSLFE